MTDYAGPVLGVVGAVVGFVVGGPGGATWGWAIGSTLGGMYSASQQVIPGPKIGDVQRQTQQEGGFRPIVYGRSHPIAGNVIADGGPVIVKKRQRQGKGGPKVETESAYRTYAVGFCEGEAILLQAWRNGILVYDAEDPSMAAENAKFLEYATWYTGSFDQPASPDLEEIYGVGQAPYFRGTAYLSLHNEDVTDQRGAWSQWQVRVFRGAARSYTTPPYPVVFTDSLSITSFAHKSDHYTFPVEGMSVESLALGGTLKDTFLSYASPPEEMDISSIALGGTLGTPLQHYDYEPEPLDISSVALGGDLEVVLLRYQNYEPETMDISSVALGGTLT